MDGGDEYDSGRVFVVKNIVEGGSVEDEEVVSEFNCSMADNRRRMGRPLPGKTTADNPGDCCRKCDETVRCFSWSFQKATGRCRMYDALAPTRSNLGFVSGDVF